MALRSVSMTRGPGSRALRLAPFAIIVAIFGYSEGLRKAVLLAAPAFWGAQRAGLRVYLNAGVVGFAATLRRLAGRGGQCVCRKAILCKH